MNNTPCKKSDIIKCDSFYDVIESLTNSECPTAPLHRICSLLRKEEISYNKKNGTNKQITLIKEELVENEEALQEDANLYIATNTKVKSISYRLSFFLHDSEIQEDLSNFTDNDFLGYAILKISKDENGNNLLNNIYESVIKSPKLLNNYIHCQKEFSCKVLNKEFIVNGSFYCQQNSLSNVCASASLRMALNNIFSDKRISYEDIYKAINIKPEKRKLGFLPGQIFEVIKSFGLNYYCEDYFLDPQYDYLNFLHSVVDSGHYGLLIFRCLQDSHIIPVIGHTLNTDIWFNRAQRAYSNSADFHWLHNSGWASHLIINDDNYGMYYCLDGNSLNKQSIPKYDPFMRVFAAIGISNSKAENSPPRLIKEVAYYYIEQIRKKKILSDTYSFLLNNNKNQNFKWLYRFIKALDNQGNRSEIVCRTFLLSKEEYLAHLKNLNDSSINTISEAEINNIVHYICDQEYFWIVELSLCDLFSANKRKLGEILLKNTPPKSLNESLIAMRLPYFWIFPDKLYPSDISSHTNMFRRHSPSDEW